MSLETLRTQIDSIDQQLGELFARRMAVSGEIAQEKAREQRPIRDARREQEKLDMVWETFSEELAPLAQSFFSQLMSLSRSYQSGLLLRETPLYEQIQRAIAETAKTFPTRAAMGCQGVEGAYSQLAAQGIMAHPQTLFFQRFQHVFSALESGLCRYALVPVENSTAGSVNQVYDLMRQHQVYIVRSIRMKIDHALMAKPGVALEDVKEVFSHEQALGQCAGFLESLPQKVKCTCWENTAAAARAVAHSARRDVAAICSQNCQSLYGLAPLAADIQDRGSNYTRFLCLSKQLEIYPGADRSSVTLVLPHRPGALAQVLSRIYALGINLLKLESRPLPDRDFQFQFYFDLETSVYEKPFAQLMRELPELAESFQYLGSYREVMG